MATKEFTPTDIYNEMLALIEAAQKIDVYPQMVLFMMKLVFKISDGYPVSEEETKLFMVIKQMVTNKLKLTGAK